MKGIDTGFQVYRERLEKDTLSFWRAPDDYD